MMARWVVVHFMLFLVVAHPSHVTILLLIVPLLPFDTISAVSHLRMLLLTIPRAYCSTATTTITSATIISTRSPITDEIRLHHIGYEEVQTIRRGPHDAIRIVAIIPLSVAMSIPILVCPPIRQLRRQPVHHPIIVPIQHAVVATGGPLVVFPPRDLDIDVPLLRQVPQDAEGLLREVVTGRHLGQVGDPLA